MSSTYKFLIPALGYNRGETATVSHPNEIAFMEAFRYAVKVGESRDAEEDATPVVVEDATPVVVEDATPVVVEDADHTKPKRSPKPSQSVPAVTEPGADPDIDEKLLAEGV